MSRLMQLADITPARADVRRFETAAAVLWRRLSGPHAAEDDTTALHDIAMALHGIAMTTTGTVRAEALFLHEIIDARMAASFAHRRHAHFQRLAQVAQIAGASA